MLDRIHLLFALKFNLAFFLILFGIAAFVISLAFLVKIWRINQDSEAAQIIRMVKRANEGDATAQAGCDQSPFVSRRLVYKKGKTITRYRASRQVYQWL